MTSVPLSAFAARHTAPASPSVSPVSPPLDGELPEDALSRRPYTHAMIDFLSAFLPPEKPAPVTVP